MLHGGGSSNSAERCVCGSQKFKRNELGEVSCRRCGTMLKGMKQHVNEDFTQRGQIIRSQKVS